MSLDKRGQDVLRFLRLALQVAQRLKAADPQVRLLFVRGPYYPARSPVPAPFEVVNDEQQMAALLKISRGAVIRAGFNTTWECLSAGTPFLPLVGTTFEEPVVERIERMQSLGLAARDIDSLWFNEPWRAEYRRVTGEVAARFPGRPDPAHLEKLVFEKAKPRSRREARRELRAPQSAQRAALRWCCASPT